MLIDIIEVKPLDNYKLELKFENGVRKIVDFKETVFNHNGPVIRPLRDEAYFKTVRVNIETGTIEWESGYDCDPGLLYEKGITI